MLGHIIYGEGPRAPELGERMVAGGRFTALCLGRSAHPNFPLARRRAALGARKLWEMGVRRAVFPLDFPYTALFIRQGITPVDPLPLRRALAAPLARRRLGEMGLSPTQAVVAVAGDRLSRETADAAKALGMTYPQTMRRIVIPQMIRNVLPPISNETINLVKDTSLIYILAMNDLLRVARTIVQREFDMTPFVIAAVFYLVMTFVLTWIFKKLEAHYAKYDQ